MRINKICVVGAIFFACGGHYAFAADYVPVGAAPPPSISPSSPAVAAAPATAGFLGRLVSRMVGSQQSVVEVRGDKADEGPVQFGVCATPPTVADIGGSFKMKKYVMSRKAASKLNIVGMGEAEVGGTELLAVFEFSRPKECLATDGKTRLVYGQAIRTVMSFASADAKASVTFPMVAASATMAGKASTINIENIGFNDASMASKAVALGLINLDVDSYAEFAKLNQELMLLAAAPATVLEVRLIGIIPPPAEDEFKNTLVSAFAIQTIKNGKSCADAKEKFNSPTDANALNVVDSTYTYITGGCSNVAPTKISIDKAKDYLRGMSVKL